MPFAGKRRVAAIVGMLYMFPACYQYTPIRSAPTVGSQVALEINDDGRVALRDQLGPGVVRLEGRVSAVEGDAMVLQASSVTQIRGAAIPLDTLQVRISQGYVERMDERRLSRTRTWMVIGSAVAIVATFFVSKGTFGKSTPPENPPGGPPVDQYRGY